jgi:hypothetical protein
MNWIENPLFHQILSEKSSKSIFTNKLGSCGEEGERGKTKKLLRSYLSPEVLADKLLLSGAPAEYLQVPRQFPFLQYNLHLGIK